MANTNDPRAKQMYNMLVGKSPAEIEQLARNLYSSSGKNYDQAAGNIKRNTGM